MTLPTITPVEPPVATTLGHCDFLDVVELWDRQWIVGMYETAASRFLNAKGMMLPVSDDTPVLLVARVQLEGGGK